MKLCRESFIKVFADKKFDFIRKKYARDWSVSEREIYKYEMETHFSSPKGIDYINELLRYEYRKIRNGETGGSWLFETAKRRIELNKNHPTRNHTQNNQVGMDVVDQEGQSECGYVIEMNIEPVDATMVEEKREAKIRELLQQVEENVSDLQTISLERFERAVDEMTKLTKSLMEEDRLEIKMNTMFQELNDNE